MEAWVLAKYTTLLLMPWNEFLHSLRVNSSCWAGCLWTDLLTVAVIPKHLPHPLPHLCMELVHSKLSSPVSQFGERGRSPLTWTMLFYSKVVGRNQLPASDTSAAAAERCAVRVAGTGGCQPRDSSFRWRSISGPDVFVRNAGCTHWQPEERNWMPHRDRADR